MRQLGRAIVPEKFFMSDDSPSYCWDIIGANKEKDPALWIGFKRSKKAVDSARRYKAK